MSKPVFNSGLNHSRRYKDYSNYYYRGAVLYWVLLALFFTSVILLPFLSVDVTIQSRGKIHSLNQVTPIHASVTSQIKKVSIQENIKVGKGDTLFWLNCSGLDNEIVNMDQQLIRYNSFLEDLSGLLAAKGNDNLMTTLYRKEFEDYKSELLRRQRLIRKTTIDYNRSSKLFKERVIAEAEFIEDSFKLQQANDNLSVYKSGVFAKWESDRKEYANQINELNARKENLVQEKNKYVIVAPLSGLILDYNGKRAGSFVQEDELLCQLSPLDSLIVECYVTPSDIGLIRDDMDVQFQVKAFPYNDWGLASGRVIDIGGDVVKVNDQWLYKVKCSLNKNYLQLSNGVKGNFKKGMDLTGRFIVTRRTLYQLLFDKVDNWLNPKIIHKAAEE